MEWLSHTRNPMDEVHELLLAWHIGGVGKAQRKPR